MLQKSGRKPRTSPGLVFINEYIFEYLQSQPHRRPTESDLFPQRFVELGAVVQKMDSDGIRQTAYQIVNKTVQAEYIHITAKNFN